jgi:hypothetical protein
MDNILASTMLDAPGEPEEALSEQFAGLLLQVEVLDENAKEWLIAQITQAIETDFKAGLGVEEGYAARVGRLGKRTC